MSNIINIKNKLNENKNNKNNETYQFLNLLKSEEEIDDDTLDIYNKTMKYMYKDFIEENKIKEMDDKQLKEFAKTVNLAKLTNEVYDKVEDELADITSAAYDETMEELPYTKTEIANILLYVLCENAIYLQAYTKKFNEELEKLMEQTKNEK